MAFRCGCQKQVPICACWYQFFADQYCQHVLQMLLKGVLELLNKRLPHLQYDQPQARVG